MKRLLQEFVPYPESLKWQIHHHYYQNRGAQAWLQQEVPWHITSNSQATYQHAAILFEILTKKEEKEAHFSPGPYSILEVGAGLGAFAINFMAIFQEICQKANKPYFLHYLFTDFSKQSLKEAALNPNLKELHQKGVLDFYLLDALAPEKMETLKGIPYKLEEKSLLGIIENYLHCALPLTVLKKQENQFYEKQLSLFYETKETKTQQELKKDFLTHPTQPEMLKKIQEEFKYTPIDLSRYTNEEAVKTTLLVATQELMEATIVFPYASFQHFKQFLPFLTTEGVFFISDKGFANTHLMKAGTEEVMSPSIHGNSLGHPVNFPLLEIYAQQLGFATARTKNGKNYLQTLSIFSQENQQIAHQAFEVKFISENLNQKAETLWLKAAEANKNLNLEQAKQDLLQCLQYRTRECNLFFELAECCMNLNQTTEALEYYDEGRKFNYFRIYDFDFLCGKAHLKEKRYPKAIEFFTKSLTDFGDPIFCYYNIGLAYEGLKSYSQALKAYQKSIKASKEEKNLPPKMKVMLRQKQIKFYVLFPLAFLLFFLLLFIALWLVISLFKLF